MSTRRIERVPGQLDDTGLDDNAARSEGGVAVARSQDPARPSAPSDLAAQEPFAT